MLFQWPWRSSPIAAIYIGMWTPQSVASIDWKGFPDGTGVPYHDFPVQGASQTNCQHPGTAPCCGQAPAIGIFQSQPSQG